MVHVVSVGVKENKTEQKKIVKEHLYRQGNKKIHHLLLRTYICNVWKSGLLAPTSYA